VGNRFQRPGRRRRSGDASQHQPGFPAGEARLIDVRETEGAVILAFAGGLTAELAPGSVPAGLPPVGEMVPAPLMAEVKLAAERKQVARLIFAMLDRRLQPVARIRDKIAEKGYSKQATDEVLDQMAAKGLYSDRQYAEAYCRDCLATRLVGRRYLVSKLCEKRVPADLAQEVAARMLDSQTEAELAARAAAVRWERLRGAGDLKTLAKVVRHLQGRGFDSSTANRAARRTRPDREQD
jgi:SOS response regulatory protein OraA/RecX